MTVLTPEARNGHARKPVNRKRDRVAAERRPYPLIVH